MHVEEDWPGWLYQVALRLTMPPSVDTRESFRRFVASHAVTSRTRVVPGASGPVLSSTSARDDSSL